MSSNQYTIRGIPPSLDKELRTMARKSGRSLNSVMLDVLRIGLDIPDWVDPKDDLDNLFGKLHTTEANLLDKAVNELRTIDVHDRQ